METVLYVKIMHLKHTDLDFLQFFDLLNYKLSAFVKTKFTSIMDVVVVGCSILVISQPIIIACKQ